MLNSQRVTSIELQLLRVESTSWSLPPALRMILLVGYLADNGISLNWLLKPYGSTVDIEPNRTIE